MKSRRHKVRKAHHHPDNAIFIRAAAIPAHMSETKTGVPASITIAQAVLESGWGRHHIGSANNYFGVKAHEHKGKIVIGSVATGYVDRRTREHIKGGDIFITDHFRQYANKTDSFIDHGLWIKSNQRYSKALKEYANSGDADAFARALQKHHYATDPHYAELLISIMKRHNLYKYNAKKLSNFE
jgi:flagellar protein FlgJ